MLQRDDESEFDALALFVSASGVARPAGRPTRSLGYGSSQTDSTSGMPGGACGAAFGPKSWGSTRLRRPSRSVRQTLDAMR